VYLGGREGMRATQKQSSPEWVHKYLSGAMGGVHNGMSFILLEDVAFRREALPGAGSEETANGTTGISQVLIFALEDRELMGTSQTGRDTTAVQRLWRPRGAAERARPSSKLMTEAWAVFS